MTESYGDEFDIVLNEGIKIESDNMIESIKLLSYDGKAMFKESNLYQNIYHIGDNFKAGIYFIIIILQDKGNYFRKVFLN